MAISSAAKDLPIHASCAAGTVDAWVSRGNIGGILTKDMELCFGRMKAAIFNAT